MIINRLLENIILKRLFKGKAIIIYGPRQAGKTTMVNNILKKIDKKYIFLNGDQYDIREMLSDTTSTQLKSIIGKNDIVVIDEAQRIKNIGLTIKLIIDNIPKVQVIATGSSSFELANKISEPLTGRKFEFLLLPFSFVETSNYFGIIDEKRMLNERLIYGYYPETVVKPEFKKEYLREIANSYLYKDILIWENIRKTEKLEKLVRLLAFQVGNEVSYTELGKNLGIDNETVEKYINLLEKAFVIFKLGSFSRNLRNELKKKKKIYFYDNGLRNAIINNFNPIVSRTDIGALWENFVISERIKYLKFKNIYANYYFWRTKDQREVDYIEEKNNEICGFEITYSTKTKKKIPKTFLKTYPNAKVEIITKDNFENIFEEENRE